MKVRPVPCLLALIMLIPAASAEDPPPTGEEVLRLVRLSYALQDYKLTGQLRDSSSGRMEAFTLNMEQNIVRFRFSNPSQIVHLDLSTVPASLRSVQAGSAASVPLSQYGESVRGFAMNYEDLSMRFLYWPGAKILGERSFKTQKCWEVRVTNPDSLTPYGTVDMLVHQGSGGVARMEAYDFKGKLVKRFEVVKIQKLGNTTILKEMKVEAYDPASGKRSSITYMTLDNPVRE